MSGLNVLSLFDGISCGQVALERAGLVIENYFASEVKPHAIKCTQRNFPKTVQLGDIRLLDTAFLPKIDILLFGSPCQDFTRLKVGEMRKGLLGEKSSLFWWAYEILKNVNPTYFLFENVRMREEQKREIDNLLGVQGICINSNLFTFQNRERYYWTNIPFPPTIEDMRVSFQDYKDTDTDYCRKFKVKRTPSREKMWREKCKNVTYATKVNCLTCKQDRWSNSGLVAFEDFCRYLTTQELEQAQTLPIGYTDGLSIRQAEDVLGDAWTVDVVAHILRGINDTRKNGK